MPDSTSSAVDGGADSDTRGTNACVPPPVPPDDPDAWCALDGRERYDLPAVGARTDD